MPEQYREAIIKMGGVYVGALKDVDAASRRVTVRYTAFDNEDSDGDIGTKGMTLKSVAETGPSSAQPRIKHFLNHDVNIPLGNPVEMGEDNIGAWAVSQIGDHDAGLNFMKMARSGLITEHSYGLAVVRRDTKNRKRMLEVKVKEFSSLTHWGANSLTPILQLSKSMTKQEEIEHWIKKQEALEKFCRNSDATDDCIENLLLQCKFLTQHIIDLTNTTPAAAKAQEAPGTREDYSDLLKSITEIKF